MDPILRKKLQQQDDCLNRVEMLVLNIDRFLLQLEKRSDPDYEQAMKMIQHEVRVIKACWGIVNDHRQYLSFSPSSLTAPAVISCL